VHDVLLGLGSNSDPNTNLITAIGRLGEFCSDIRPSPCYLTSAINRSHPDYLNLVVLVRTELDLEPLLNKLKALEIAQGRQKGILCTLDIDLLCFDQCITSNNTITLPSEDLERYAHALKPTSDLCPDRQHPVLGYTYIELWNKKSAKLLENQTLYPHPLV